MQFINSGMVQLTIYGLNNDPFSSNYPTKEDLDAIGTIETATINVKGLFAEPLFDFIATELLNNTKVIRKLVKAKYAPITVPFSFPADGNTPFEEYYLTSLFKCTYNWIICNNYNIPLQAQMTDVAVKVNILSYAITHNDNGTKVLKLEFETAGTV